MHFHAYSSLLRLWESGADAIDVGRVVAVRVDIAVIVHIAEVRRIGDRRATQEEVIGSKP